MAETIDVVAEAETIKELDREWVRRYAARDVDWIAARHTEDAVLMAPGLDDDGRRRGDGRAWRRRLRVRRPAQVPEDHCDSCLAP